MTIGFVITRRLDGRAIMEGTNLCQVRWGYDAARVRVYDTVAGASEGMRLLCDEDSETLVVDAATWCTKR